MNKTKIIFKVIFGIAAFVAFLFLLELFGLEWRKFFNPKKANIEREVFEQTKSYTHGKIQGLAKLYGEYQDAETQVDKAVIENIIIIQFAEFDETKIKSKKLREFLIKTRRF